MMMSIIVHNYLGLIKQKWLLIVDDMYEEIKENIHTCILLLINTYLYLYIMI